MWEILKNGFRLVGVVLDVIKKIGRINREKKDEKTESEIEDIIDK